MLDVVVATGFFMHQRFEIFEVLLVKLSRRFFER